MKCSLENQLAIYTGPISGLISRKNGLYSYTFFKNGLVQKALLLTSKSEIEMLDDGDAKARLKDLHTSALEEIVLAWINLNPINHESTKLGHRHLY